MDSIIIIDGQVNFKITLDPGVWIVDDQKIDIDTYFSSEENTREEHVAHSHSVKSISQYWEREIQEGSVFPQTLKTEKRFEKEKLISGTFGLPLSRFLHNAGPKESATQVIIATESENITIPLNQAAASILVFSQDGKPLLNDGPVHLYFGDGSNRRNPIKHIRKFTVL